MNIEGHFPMQFCIKHYVAFILNSVCCKILASGVISCSLMCIIDTQKKSYHKLYKKYSLLKEVSLIDLKHQCF